MYCNRPVSCSSNTLFLPKKIIIIMTSNSHYQLIYKNLSSSSQTHFTDQSSLIVHYFHYHYTISPCRFSFTCNPLHTRMTSHQLGAKVRNCVIPEENHTSVLMCTSLNPKKHQLKILMCKHVTLQTLFYPQRKKCIFWQSIFHQQSNQLKIILIIFTPEEQYSYITSCLNPLQSNITFYLPARS